MRQQGNRAVGSAQPSRSPASRDRGAGSREDSRAARCRHRRGRSSPATSIAKPGSAPVPALAKSSRPMPIAAASLPTIPSIPSMKLNRLVHQIHSKPIATKPAQPSPGARAQMPMVTTTIWASRRNKGDKPRKSSTQETTAKIPAPSETPMTPGTASPAPASTNQASSSEPITAMPPPRGVGTRCAERSFGWSRMSRRRRIGTSALVAKQERTPVASATAADKPASPTPGRVVPGNLTLRGVVCDRSSGLPANRPTHGRAPWGHRPAQHDLLGFPRLPGAEIDALAEAYLGASRAQPPDHAARQTQQRRVPVLGQRALNRWVQVKAYSEGGAGQAAQLVLAA